MLANARLEVHQLFTEKTSFAASHKTGIGD